MRCLNYVTPGCIGEMNIVALSVPFHKANERGFRHPESKNPLD